MSFNQGYQDGLGGMKRPSNGDWGSFNAGSSARHEQAFYAGLRSQQQNSWSNSSSNSWSSWSPTPSRPSTAEWTAGDQAAFNEFWSAVGLVLLMAWLCFVCVIAFACMSVFWLLRAMISIAALVGRLRNPAGLTFVVRCLDPTHAALSTVEEWVSGAALWLLELFSPKTENTDPPKG